jgi:signal transduction histidine kinase
MPNSKKSPTASIATKTPRTKDAGKVLAESLYKRGAEIAEKNKTLSLLNKLYETSALALEPKKLATQVVQIIQESLFFELVGIFQYNEETRELEPVAFASSDRLQKFQSNSKIFFDDIKIPVEQSAFVYKTISEGKSDYTENLADIWDSIVPESVYKKIGLEGHIKSSLAYPLVSGGQTIGLLLFSLNRHYDQLLEHEKESISNFVNVVAVALDKALLNEQLKIANKQLELANKRQQETLRFITHEVKGYLTDGAAALDAILTESFGPVTQDTKAMVGEALTKNRNAVREIQNFLRIADFKTGKVSYAVETFDFKQKLEEALAPLEENAKNKGLSFTTEIAQGKYKVVGDADQLLGHVVGNLINNAISYTPQGEIVVRLVQSDGKLLFSIKDSGVGLSDDDKAVLFTEGGHGKESRTVNPHSTGYGLFIARRIVEAHKGRLWAESEGRGKGSTFLVELPTTLSPKDFTK